MVLVLKGIRLVLDTFILYAWYGLRVEYYVNFRIK